jgi:DNA-directed RNA polymerase specialized sigma24 family protein
MILYINDKLNLWAAWVATGRKVRGLGYPSQVAFMRLTPSSRSLQAPILNDEACEIDSAVCALERQLREVVDQFYLHAGTAETHAKALRICRDTLYSRLHQAHARILERLQMGEDDADGLTGSDTYAIKQVR